MGMIFLALTGIVLGVSAVIPGLSMGTTAVTFNVYDRLIAVITPNIKKIFAAWKFWLPLLIGIGIGIIFFSRLASFLFDNYPVPTYWFFIGLITGGIPLIFGKMLGTNLFYPREQSSAAQKTKLFPSKSSIICAIAALAVMILFAVVKPEETAAYYTELNLQLFVLLLLGGILSALAMIVPGISGSFMLLVIGLYRTVVQSISDFNLPILCAVALGVTAGLFAGAAGIRLLLAKAPKATYGAVMGLVLGSIIILFKVPDTGIMLVLSIITFIGGFAISFFAGRRNKYDNLNN